jgi:hypothetical protein
MALVSKTFGDIITFTRASTATYFDSAGTLQSAAIDAPRLDYNPSTLAAQGLLIEESRTNSIRNNTMVGAVAGTPGTICTNWIAATPSNGLARQIVGTGTENGITYIDIRYSGTTSAASLTAIYWETATQVAAVSGQSWTNSVYVALVGGSTANIIGTVVGIDENNGAGSFLAGSTTVFVPSAGALQGKRVAHTRTLTNASTASVSPYVYFNYASGVAIDITLRIGLPQLELGAFATSVIPTTTTALTRAADVASVNTLSPWFNATQGTLYAETQLSSIVARNSAGFDFNDGTTNNRNIFRALTPIGGDQNVVRSGGVLSSALVSATSPTTAIRKSAAAYAASDFAFTSNGSTPATTPSGAVPSGMNVMLLGSGIGPTEFLGGYLRRITYYPRRLTDAELQTLTA